jgi:hypothetical protein
VLCIGALCGFLVCKSVVLMPNEIRQYAYLPLSLSLSLSLFISIFISRSLLLSHFARLTTLQLNAVYVGTAAAAGVRSSSRAYADMSTDERTALWVRWLGIDIAGAGNSGGAGTAVGGGRSNAPSCGQSFA